MLDLKQAERDLTKQLYRAVDYIERKKFEVSCSISIYSAELLALVHRFEPVNKVWLVNVYVPESQRSHDMRHEYEGIADLSLYLKYCVARTMPDFIDALVQTRATYDKSLYAATAYLNDFLDMRETAKTGDH